MLPISHAPSGSMYSVTKLAVCLFMTSMMSIQSWSVTYAQDMRLGQRLILIADIPMEVEFVDGGSATVDSNHLFLFYESAPNYHVCYYQGKQAYIPSRSVAPSAEAEKIFRKRCEEHASAKNFVSLTYACLWNGHYRSGLESARKGLELEPENVELQLLLGKCQSILKMESEAELTFNNLADSELKSDRLKALLLDYRGSLALEEDDPETGIKHLEEAVELDPFSPRMRCNLGLMHFNLEDLAKAREYFEEAERIDPASAIPVIFLAYVTGEENTIEEAVPLMKKAVEVDPGTAQPWSYLHWHERTKNLSDGEREKKERQIKQNWALARAADNNIRFNVGWELATSEDENIRDVETAAKICKLIYESTVDNQPLACKMIEAAILVSQDKTDKAEAVLNQIEDSGQEPRMVYPSQWKWLEDAIEK